MAVAETSVTPEGGLPGAQPELLPPQAPDMAAQADPSYAHADVSESEPVNLNEAPLGGFY
jgi:hypothetical protein